MSNRRTFLKKALLASAGLICPCTRFRSSDRRTRPWTPGAFSALGYPEGSKLLTLHADDVGLRHSVNRATISAFEKGGEQQTADQRYEVARDRASRL